MALGWHRNGVIRRTQDHRRIVNLQRAIWPPNRGLFGTAEFAHYFKQQLFAMRRGYTTPSKSDFDNYFKFSIVRNPWDRVHSWYRNVVKDPNHRHNFDVTKDCSFTEFFDRHINCWALDPQLEWLTDKSGHIAVDYIGKFEDVANSYLYIQKQIRLKEGKLPALLRTDRVDYRPAYSNSHRNIVAAKYAEEIEMFGYTFE